MDALFIRAAVARTPGLRATHLAALLTAADGDLTRCLNPKNLSQVELPPAALAWLRLPDTAAVDSDLRWLADSGARLLASTDRDYPEQLRQLADAPAALYVLGDPRQLAAPQLAMVGSRNPTPFGSETAFRFAADLAGAGLTITSGLALGIDAASPRGALSVASIAGSADGVGVAAGVGTAVGGRASTRAAAADVAAIAGARGQSDADVAGARGQSYPGAPATAGGRATPGVGTTIAVCGTGLDQVYPTQHNELAARIREHGALVSELPPRTPPRRANFPRRNRLISGLSLATLVVEARLNSGSLSTARYARQQQRKVLAIPGSIASSLSLGCHRLIRTGASLVQSCDEVLLELEISPPNEGLVRRGGPRRRRRAMDKGYEMLLDAVGFGPVGVDILAIRTGLPAEMISSMLLVLELEGRIALHPGGQFGRIP